MNEGRQMTSRIPVTPETHRRIQAYAQGLGATFDDALNFVFDKMLGGDAPSWPAGDKARDEYLEWKKKQSDSEQSDK